MHEDELYELPAGWTWAKLEDVGHIVTGNTPSKSEPENYGDNVPWVKPPDLDRDQPICMTREMLSIEGAKKARVLPKGSVLVSCIGILGKVGFAGTELATNQQINSIVFNEDAIYPKYGFYYCKTLKEWLHSVASATTVPIVNKMRFSQAPIAVPPILEQKRIVVKVEALFGESKTAREALDKVPVLLRRFRQSVLAKAFRGELTPRDPNDEPAQKLLERIRQKRKKGKQTSLAENQKEPSAELPKLPETWIWTTIGELETFIGSGITPRGGKKVYVDSGILFIRSQNVHPDGLHLENIARITPKIHEQMKRTKVHPNDVLLNITGASIGRSTYIPEKFGEANVNQHVCIIRTGWWIVPAYLSYFLNSTYGQDQIFATESGVTREGLNYTQVRSLWIPLAPVAEQKRVMAKIGEAFSIARQIETAVKKARERAERIDQAILAKAFRGELVPQDPNDEPASVLLQHIKSKTKQQGIIQTKLTS